MRALLVLLVLVAACDYPRSQPIGGDDVPFDADPNAIDADPNAPDADPNAPDADLTRPDAPPGCVAGPTQCTNCLDDDADGEAVGDDVECTGAHDNDEGSFDDGIPGDNVQSTQDCFFDDTAGAGDDGCAHPQCCSTGACPGNAACLDPQTSACVSFCSAITVPGCDCFGCCTVCQGSNCFDITLNPALSPDCTYDNLGDPANCPTCTKYGGCGVPCGAAQCITCHGQTVADLATACAGDRVCPSGLGECELTSDCGINQWCSNGCCIAQLQ
jgi:hypothetical protein